MSSESCSTLWANFNRAAKVLADRELALDRLRGAFKRAAEKFAAEEFSDEEIAEVWKS
jgi:hypothetical protein